MSLFELYLFTRLDEIKELLDVEGFRFLTFFGVLAMCTLKGVAKLGELKKGDAEKMDRFSNRGLKISILPVLMFFWIIPLIQASIPTQKDMAIIIGLHQLTNNEEVQKLPDNITKLINSKLEEFTDKDNPPK